MPTPARSQSDVMDDIPPQNSLIKTHAGFCSRSNSTQKPSLSHARTIASTPPFRVGGRGSKQLSKAIEKSSLERDQAGDVHNEPQWAFCVGKHPCFAKIVSVNNPKSVIIQPMFSNDQDPHLFTLWEGHLWMAKSDKIHHVKMKQEIGGWRLQLTRDLQHLLERYSHTTTPGSLIPLPTSLGTATSNGDQWDLVSLESSDLDDCSSVNSSMIFPLLEKSAVTHSGVAATACQRNNTGVTSDSPGPHATTPASTNSDKITIRNTATPGSSIGVDANISGDRSSHGHFSPLSHSGSTLTGSDYNYSQSQSLSNYNHCKNSSYGNNTSTPNITATPSPCVRAAPNSSLSTSISGGRKSTFQSHNGTSDSHLQQHQQTKQPKHHNQQQHLQISSEQRSSPVPMSVHSNQAHNRFSPVSSGSSMANSGHTPSPQRPILTKPRPYSSPPPSFSPSPSISSSAAAGTARSDSPLPFPRRCCEPMLGSFSRPDTSTGIDIQGRSLEQTGSISESVAVPVATSDASSVSGLMFVPASPAVSVASSALSPCVLPCPSSAGSSHSGSSFDYGYSSLYQRTASGADCEEEGLFEEKVSLWDPSDDLPFVENVVSVDTATTAVDKMASDGGIVGVVTKQMAEAKGVAGPVEYTPTNDLTKQRKMNLQKHAEQQHFINDNDKEIGSNDSDAETDDVTTICPRKGIAFFETPITVDGGTFPVPMSASVQNKEVISSSSSLAVNISSELISQSVELEKEKTKEMKHIEKKSSRLSCVDEAIYEQAIITSSLITTNETPLSNKKCSSSKSSQQNSVTDSHSRTSSSDTNICLHQVRMTPDRKNNHHLKRKLSSDSKPELKSEPESHQLIYDASTSNSTSPSPAVSLSRTVTLPPQNKKAKIKKNRTTSNSIKSQQQASIVRCLRTRDNGIISVHTDSSSSSGGSGSGRRSKSASRPPVPPAATPTTSTTTTDVTTSRDSGRPSRRAVSTKVHRDACFGSWPTRTQSGSKGTWSY